MVNLIQARVTWEESLNEGRSMVDLCTCQWIGLIGLIDRGRLCPKCGQRRRVTGDDGRPWEKESNCLLCGSGC